MTTNYLKTGALMVGSVGIGTVTRRMVKNRAIALALLDGRSDHEVSPADWEQAKRELSGKPDLNSNEEILEAAPESARWSPVPVTAGHKVEASGSEDEDTDGRSDNEILVEQGINEALLDQAKAASDYSRSIGY